MIYGVFCVGLNFFMGYTGQASFGQNAFAAIGGYGTAILCVEYGWEPVLALLVIDGDCRRGGAWSSAIRRCGCAAIISPWRPSRSASSPTICRCNGRDLTQGYMGYSGIPPLGIGPFTVEGERAKLVWLMVFCSPSASGSRAGCAIRASAGRCARSRQASRAPPRSASACRNTSSPLSSSPRFTPRRQARCSRMSLASSAPRCSACRWWCVTFTMLYVGGIGTVLGPRDRRRHRVAAAGDRCAAPAAAGHRLCGRSCC